MIAENKAGNLTQAKIDGDKATLTVLKGGFGQLTAVAVVGKTVWVAESKFAQRDNPNNRDPGPWVITLVALPGWAQLANGLNLFITRSLYVASKHAIESTSAD